MKNLSAVPMGGHKAEEPLQLHHGPLRRGGEDTGKGTGSREDPTIHTPPIVEQIANGIGRVWRVGKYRKWGAGGPTSRSEEGRIGTYRDGEAACLTPRGRRRNSMASMYPG